MTKLKPLPTFQTFRVCAESTDRRLIHVRTMSAAAAWHLASLIDPHLFVHDDTRPDWQIVSVESVSDKEPALVDESQPVEPPLVEPRLAESPDDELAPRRKRRQRSTHPIRRSK